MNTKMTKVFSERQMILPGRNIRGTEEEKSAFWVVTVLAAVLLVIMLGVETILNSETIFSHRLNTVFTISLIVLAMLWVVVGLLLKTRLPLWSGLVGYGAVVSVVAYHFAYSVDPFAIATSLQTLPVAGLYLAWFWPPLRARIIFAITVVLMTAAAIIGPTIGASGAVHTSVLIFCLFVFAFAFFLGSSLQLRLQARANMDQLTKAWNLRGFKTKVMKEMVRARERGEVFSIAVIDFDLLKKINDEQGHSFGDLALRTTVDEWKSGIRSYDVVARTGGDEFAILFPRTKLQDAQNIVSRLKETASFEWSCGVASYEEGDSFEKIMARADALLYETKMSKPSRSGNDSGVREPETEPKSRKGFTEWGDTGVGRNIDLQEATIALGAIIFISLTIALLMGEIPSSNRFVLALMVSFTVASGLLLVFVKKIISAVPDYAPIIFASGYSVIYLVLMIVSGTSYHSASVLFAFTILAIYLGAFSGSTFSRLFLSSVIIVAALILLNKYPEAQPDGSEIFLLAISIYSFLTQFFIFEISSYLFKVSSDRANYDALTGLLNRYGLDESGVIELQRSSRGGHDVSVAVLDCDGFKEINDREGHLRGDELLRELSQHITLNLAGFDIVARVGGDEFVSVMPYLSSAEAEAKIEYIASTSPTPLSFGVVQVRDDETLYEALERADQKLYNNRRSRF